MRLVSSLRPSSVFFTHLLLKIILMWKGVGIEENNLPIQRVSPNALVEQEERISRGEISRYN